MKFSLTAALVLLIIGALLSDTNAASQKLCKGKKRKKCCLHNGEVYKVGDVVEKFDAYGLQLICGKKPKTRKKDARKGKKNMAKLTLIKNGVCTFRNKPTIFEPIRSKALKWQGQKKGCRWNYYKKYYSPGSIIKKMKKSCFQLVCNDSKWEAETIEKESPCLCNKRYYKYQWDYIQNEGQDSWTSFYKYCSGKRQTPIKIFEKEVKQNQSLGKFNFVNYDKVPNKATLHNDSDDVRYYIETPDEDRPYITGGGLQSEYVFYQMHFHWGSEDDGGRGAEHELDDQIYPITVHFIHFKREYKDYNTAREKPDGLAVFGFPCKIVEEDNEKLSNLVDVLKEIEEYDATVEVETKPLFEYLGRTNEYYRYDGSAATPPCFESVTWSVFFTGYPMSQRQLDLFRKYPKTRFGDNISGNFRELQPLNDRVVYKYTESFLEETTTTGPPTTSPPTTHPNYTPL